jgi:hypothetical protein
MFSMNGASPPTERTLATAQAAEAAEHRVSSAESFLRASANFGVAVNAISALVSTAGLSSTFAKQQAAWDSFVAKARQRSSVSTSLRGTFIPQMMAYHPSHDRGTRQHRR